MPNFPALAPITVTKKANARFKDASGKELDFPLERLPIAATQLQIDTLISAMADMSNAGLMSSYVAETTAIPEGDVTALDDAESSITARAVLTFQNITLVTRSFSIPAPDLSLFDASGENVLTPGENALVSAYVDAVLDVLNAGGETFAYIGGVRDDVPYAETTPLFEAISKAQDDATKALEDAASALALANSAIEDIEDLDTSKHGRFSVFYDEAVLVTGTRTFSRIAGMDYNYGVSAGGAINNEMKISFDADISTGGIFHFQTLTNNACGIATVSIDGTVIGTIDLYSAVQVLNVDKTIAIDLGDFSQGRHTISIKGATKNPSTATYWIVITKIWFYDGSD